jgi:hypothetical protein
MAGEADRLQNGVIGISRITDDEETPRLKAGFPSRLHRFDHLAAVCVLAHEREDLVHSRFDPEENPVAAGRPHGLRHLPVHRVHPGQAFPAELETSPLDLRADLKQPCAVKGEDIVGEMHPLVSQVKHLLDLVHHVLS